MLSNVPNPRQQVVILGAGMGGAVLAAILARKGVRVLMIDAQDHPRFAIGESTTPHTSQLLSLMSIDFDVPELHEVGLGSPADIRRTIGPTSGVKRLFGFVSHRFDEEHDPRDAIQFGDAIRDENHLFRQDVDPFLVRTALKYGAGLLTATRVESVDFNEQGVHLSTSAGEFDADFVVDGTGFRSVLASKFDLRETPSRLLTNSRSIFTHMIDVEPFESCTENINSMKWSEGTTHHLFDGGWFWVIPFNNWCGSTNPLVSVGLTLDARKFPLRNELSPADEFAMILDRLPSASRQFENAKPVRSWIRTGRIQYSSTQSIGQRYCLLSHAYGFVDPLFSRGLINTMEVNYALAAALLGAIRDDDYSLERFAEVEAIQRNTLDAADKLVEAAYISWADFDLWNAWVRVWIAATGCIASNLGSYVLRRRMMMEGRGPLENYFLSPFEDPGFSQFFARSYESLKQFELGSMSATDASKEVFQGLQEYRYEMRLPCGSNTHLWAIQNPLCRDLIVNCDLHHERWGRQEVDSWAKASCDAEHASPMRCD